MGVRVRVRVCVAVYVSVVEIDSNKSRRKGLEGMKSKHSPPHLMLLIVFRK